MPSSLAICTCAWESRYFRLASIHGLSFAAIGFFLVICSNHFWHLMSVLPGQDILNSIAAVLELLFVQINQKRFLQNLGYGLLWRVSEEFHRRHDVDGFRLIIIEVVHGSGTQWIPCSQNLANLDNFFILSHACQLVDNCRWNFICAGRACLRYIRHATIFLL